MKKEKQKVNFYCEKCLKNSQKNVDPNTCKSNAEFWAQKSKKQEELFNSIQNFINSRKIRYSKRSSDVLSREDVNETWSNESQGKDYDANRIYSPIEKKRRAENLTSCARIKAYYKLTNEEKAKNVVDSMKKLGIQESDIETSQNKDETKIRSRKSTIQEVTREARLNRRHLLAECKDLVYSLRLQTKKLKLASSKIHAFGLFASEPIAANQIIIEYVGQLIRPIISDLREKKYNRMGIKGTYLFAIDQTTIIDATKAGNLARFINHSCMPNSYSKQITINNQKKIALYSNQQINIGDEITFDYNFSDEKVNSPCFCGTSQCKRSL